MTQAEMEDRAVRLLARAAAEIDELIDLADNAMVIDRVFSAAAQLWRQLVWETPAS